MSKRIELSVPNLNIEILENLRECIETGWVSTGGRFIAEFEQKMASYVGVKEAVSTQSGTAGLHLALNVLGVAPGDEVIVPTLTFIAAVNPVRYVGAEPIFMDCDDYFCIDANKLERFCKEECKLENNKLINRLTGRTISAVVVVHVFGNLANMSKIMDIAKRYHLKILEDATEALGSYYVGGRYKGCFAGTVGDIGVYSFNANKIITTGGGGMVVSRNKTYIDKVKYLSLTAKDDPLFFIHNEVGYNYRMLNLQAALGVSQIAELEEFIKIKHRNYERYVQRLSGVNGLSILPFSSDIRSNYWFYSLLIEEQIVGVSRDKLMEALIAQEIQCRPVWKLVHTQKPYQRCQAYDLEKAYRYETQILNVPCSTSLNLEDVDFVCDKILKYSNG
ncbi:LegC family aminotransferase [Anoxybacterium hadale]|uniref:LegC family aminotransferase n=1 Tax=Anoxybacterium hadale TaxID=3408580 RepID=A0ACD1AFI6_9FIRM|nr:LegC family aminotransferase [Clostridiales bacterium]